MKERGFSLIELLTVIAIISIVIAISTMDFHRWTIKSNVQKETREMYADFSRLRTKAMYTGKRHRIVLSPTSYTFKSYSVSEPLTAGTEIESKGLPYGITLENGNSVIGKTITFDTRGFTNDVLTIRVDAPRSDAAFDCLLISTGRTNMGKMKNGTCEPKK